MFTVDIRINGTLTAHIYGLNRRTMGTGDEYSYSLYEPEGSKIKEGMVKHFRNEGILVLVEKILEDYRKE